MKLQSPNIWNTNDFRVPNLYILKELWRYNKITNNEINNHKYTREKMINWYEIYNRKKNYQM